MYDSSNYVFISELDHAEAGRGLGVYKPETGERPLHDFPMGTLYQREIGAFALSQLLGWTSCRRPSRSMARTASGRCSCSSTTSRASTTSYCVRPTSTTSGWRRSRCSTSSPTTRDRKGGHVLLDPDGALWCIDNGLCFHRHPKLRTVIWDYAGSEAGDAWVTDLRCARECLLDGDAAAETLRSCLDVGEVEALAERIDEFVGHPVLPEMYPWRCVPWPLV